MNRKTHETPPANCPHCGLDFDRSDSYGGAEPPKVGNWTICINCLEVLRFGSDLKPRELTPGEREHLRTSKRGEEFTRLIATLRSFKQSNAAPPVAKTLPPKTPPAP